MGIIDINGIRCYAYHGCMPEEGTIGGEYVVDVRIETDLSKAAKSDELHDTVDYCAVHELVKTGMAVRSKLIEHVAQRIVDALRKKYPGVKTFSVTVKKIAPPLNGDVNNVAVTLEG